MQNIIHMDTSVTYVNRNSEKSLVLEPNSINKNDNKISFKYWLFEGMLFSDRWYISSIPLLQEATPPKWEQVGRNNGQTLKLHKWNRKKASWHHWQWSILPESNNWTFFTDVAFGLMLCSLSCCHAMQNWQPNHGLWLQTHPIYKLFHTYLWLVVILGKKQVR